MGDMIEGRYRVVMSRERLRLNFKDDLVYVAKVAIRAIVLGAIIGGAFYFAPSGWTLKPERPEQAPSAAQGR